MQVVAPHLVANRKIVLRLDIDLPIENGQIKDDFRLRAGIPTLNLCLQHALSTTIIGHIGRPEGKEEKGLSVEPIHDWLEEVYGTELLLSGRLKLLENLRFEQEEEACNIEFAKQLASFGDIFINEAFASHHPSSSTTILPRIMPHLAGLRFAKEVEMLTRVRNNPTHPMVGIIGGVKIEDKLPAVLALSKVADVVLVGGKIAQEISSKSEAQKANIFAAKLSADGKDITHQTVEGWSQVISKASMIVWNGPLGAVEDRKNDQTREVAELVINSGAETIIGGGDTIAVLASWGMLDKFSFVSTGGGAMLKFLTVGTLPTIEALN